MLKERYRKRQFKREKKKRKDVIYRIEFGRGKVTEIPIKK